MNSSAAKSVWLGFAKIGDKPYLQQDEMRPGLSYLTCEMSCDANSGTFAERMLAIAAALHP